MMTLQQFINLHPNIIQYDRAGVEGIDFDALHERINNSRYLRTRQSFIYFVKNYKRIINGEFDDFRLDVVEKKIDSATEKIINTAKMHLANVESFIEKVAEYNLGEYEDELIKKAKDCKMLLEKAVASPEWSVASAVEYKSFIKDLKETLGWIKGNGARTVRG